MSLTDEERRTLIGLQLERADKFMAQAEDMCRLQHWDIAANRYYYACFHAVQGLFIANGLNTRTHDGMLTCFGLHFVKTGIIDTKLGSFLTRMEQLRQKGDYNCLYVVSQEEVETMAGPAELLVSRIKELVGCDI